METAMTEEQVKRSAELIDARDTIVEFLSASDPESELVQSYLKSKWEHQVRDGRKMPKATVAEIALVDAVCCAVADEDDHDTLATWFIPRDILDRALKMQLAEISAELLALGIER